MKRSVVIVTVVTGDDVQAHTSAQDEVSPDGIKDVAHLLVGFCVSDLKKLPQH
jgi:hypothetical protein